MDFFRNSTESSSFNDAKYQEIERMFDKTASIKHCTGLIEKFTLANISVDGASDILSKYIVDHIIPFFKKLLRNILICGWSPYRLVKIKDKRTKESVLVPEIVPFEKINAKINTKKDGVSYEFSFPELNDVKNKMKIKVLTFTDLNLLAKNELIHSVCSGLVHDYKFMLTIKGFIIQAESIRSNPPIYLAGIKNDAAKLGDSMTDFGNGPRLTTTNLKSVLNQQYQEKAAVLQHASEDMASNLAYHSQQMSAASWNSQLGNDEYSYKPQHWNNLFIIPPGMQLATPPQMPDPRSDPYTAERNLNTNVYLSFGIPESLGSKGGTSNRGKATSIMNTNVNFLDVQSLESTLEKYTLFFKSVFVTLYQEIFLKELNIESVHVDLPHHFTQYIEKTVETTIDDKKKEDNAIDDKKKEDNAIDDKKKEDIVGTNQVQETREIHKEDASPNKKIKKNNS